MIQLGVRARSNAVLHMRHIVGFLFIALTLIAGFSGACAQDIEPRAYSNAPVGVNFLITGHVYTKGGLAFDPSCMRVCPEDAIIEPETM
jgi:hypothetical protein